MSSKYWLLVPGALVLGLVLAFSNKAPTLVGANVGDNEKSVKDVLMVSRQPSVKPEVQAKNIKPAPHATTPLLASQLSPIERIRQISDKNGLQQALVNEHDNFKRYPPQNNRIEQAQQDPISQRYAVDERSTQNEDNTFGITIWSDEKFYLANSTVTVFAFLQDANGQKMDGAFSAQLLDTQHQKIMDLNLQDENNDQIYQANIDLASVKEMKGQTGIYKVVIANSQHQITDALTFTLSKPDISLTGNYHDNITGDGSLLIEAEVEVTSQNRFYVQASLYSATNVPIGITEFAGDLTPGKHWVPLTYAGLMIQDAQESGPYVLEQVSVAKVTMPMQRAPLFKPDYQTESYALDEFSDSPYEP
mgnify:CR=1 FL=1